MKDPKNRISAPDFFAKKLVDLLLRFGDLYSNLVETRSGWVRLSYVG